MVEIRLEEVEEELLLVELELELLLEEEEEAVDQSVEGQLEELDQDLILKFLVSWLVAQR